jgi:hypothetical protein
MPGLLDITDDPNTAGLLSLGLRLMSTPGKFGTALGQAGLGAMGDLQQARQMVEQRKLREQQAKMQGLQMQSLEQQLADAQRAREEAQRQAERDDAFRRSIPSPQGQALQSLGADASPTLANAARLPQVDPQQQMLYDAFQARLLKTPEYLSATSPKAPEYKVVGDSLVQIGGGRVSEAFRAAPKSDPAKDLLILDPATGKLVPNQALIDVKKQLVPPGVSVSYGSPMAGQDAAGNPVFWQPDKAGGPPNIVPGVKPPQKDSALTESQAKAATYMSQMKSAEKELAGVPIDPTKLWSQVDVSLAGGLTNVAASPSAQRARQAQEQWSEAFLRFKTGAAATKDEVLLNVRTFFPQPGDKPEVIDQKKRMRQQAAQDIAFAAGQKAPANQDKTGPKPTMRWNPQTGRLEPVGG